MIAAVQSNQPPTSHVMSVAKFERFFRIVAGLDVDKQDLKRYGDFISQKLYDLLLRGLGAAKANGRVIMEPFDLPITKGVQECIHEFDKLDEEIELRPMLDHLAARRSERRGCPRLQDHRSQSEEPVERALAEVLPFV